MATETPIMKTHAPKQYRVSALPQAAPKKLSAREQRYRQECKEQTERLMSDPELYYRFHQNYEMMLYMTQMLTKVTMEMRGVAHVVFNDKNAAYKDLVKASNAYIDALKACQGVRDYTHRQDAVQEPNTDEGEAQYEQSCKDAMNLLRINRVALEILDATNQTGLVQIESALKLLYKPTMERQNKLVVAQGVLGNHLNDFSEEAIAKWRKYIYAQTEEGAKALREKKSRKPSEAQKEWAEYLSDNERR